MNDITIETVSTLKAGQEFRNYKELCEALSIAPTGGKTKKLNLKEMQRFFEYERDGNKFIIKTVYDVPKPKEDNDRNSKYQKYIECLLVNELYNKCQKNNVKTCTLIYAFKDMAYNMFMINDDFKPVHTDSWYDDNEITPAQYRAFYYQSKSMLVSYIESALNKMKQNHEIKYTVDCMLITQNNGRHDFEIMSTEDEIEYDKLFKAVLKNYSGANGKPCKTLQDLIFSGADSTLKIKRFYNELDRECMKRFGGKVIENIYVIHSAPELLEYAKDRVADYHVDIATVGKELNRKLCDNFKESKTLLINHKAKQIVAQEGFGKPLIHNKQSYSLLTEDERNLLVDSIIFIDSKDIKKHEKAAIAHKGSKA